MKSAKSKHPHPRKAKIAVETSTTTPKLAHEFSDVDLLLYQIERSPKQENL